MQFNKMDAAQYRALSDVDFDKRRSAVAAELDNPESTVDFDTLNAEVGIIEQERSRRNAAAQLRNASAVAVAKGAGTVISGASAVKSEVKVTRSEDPFDTEDYNRAFMDYVTRGKEYPAGLVQPGMVPANVRADAFTQTADVPHFIPTTLSSQIISKMSEYGVIWPQVTKLNVQGGLEISIWDYLPQASWITEDTPSDFQKVSDASRISFLYHMAEVRVAQSFLSRAVTLDAFQRTYSDKMAEALVRLLEQGVFRGTGSGQMLGFLNDPRVTDEHKTVFAEDQIKTWTGWTTLLSKVSVPYRAHGHFYMAQDTWDRYVNGLVDANGQPLARINYGLQGAYNSAYTFMGKAVDIVPEDILPSYDDAKGQAEDKPAIVFGDLRNYIVNQQEGMRFVRWNDEDKNLDKFKLQTIVDGRIGDVNGLLVINAPKA